jgi:hypothetical protein
MSTMRIRQCTLYIHTYIHESVPINCRARFQVATFRAVIADGKGIGCCAADPGSAYQWRCADARDPRGETLQKSPSARAKATRASAPGAALAQQVKKLNTNFTTNKR